MARATDFESFYRVLMDISSSVHFYSDVRHVLDILVKKTTDALDAKAALVRIYDAETCKLEMGAACGLSDGFLSQRLSATVTIRGEEWEREKVSIITDTQKDPRVEAPDEVLAEGIVMIVYAPLVLGTNTLGTIRIYFDERRELSAEEIDFIALIAEIGATLIERDRLIEIEKSRYDRLAVQTEKLSALGRLAAGIAHEINNPLGSVMLYSSALLKRMHDTEEMVRESLEIILHEAGRCKTIIQGLLEFSRESESRMESTDVGEIVEKALRVVDNELRLHRIRLEKTLEPGLPKATVDVGQIEQVLVNLLLNAAQAIEEEGLVTVRTLAASDRKKILVEISDTGCGISAKDMDKIFEPFFSTKTKGTGLGLAVSYGIVKKHSGAIHVSSEPGQGSLFTVELPVDRTKGTGG
jgi:two-component system, NtrC family, sensor kinase